MRIFCWKMQERKRIFIKWTRWGQTNVDCFVNRSDLFISTCRSKRQYMTSRDDLPPLCQYRGPIFNIYWQYNISCSIFKDTDVITNRSIGEVNIFKERFSILHAVAKNMQEGMIFTSYLNPSKIHSRPIHYSFITICAFTTRIYSLSLALANTKIPYIHRGTLQKPHETKICQVFVFLYKSI